MRSPWLVAALACAGCVVPRSMTVGQMAAPVGRGATEVGVFGGILYASQLNPPYTTSTASGDGISNQDQRRVFGAPMAEANIQHGFSEHLALNVHASPAGIQPGLKWTLNRSKAAHVALLPAFGLGYASQAHSTFSAGTDGVQTENSPGSITSFTFLGGLKVLVSHRSGFFAGVGYDLLFNRSVDIAERGTSASGDRSQVTTQTLAHQLGASVGFDIALGMVHLRPEIAFAVYPGVSTSITTRVPPTETNVGAWGGFGWAIFPGFSLAVATPPRAATVEEDEEEKAKARSRRRARDEDDEEEGEGEGEDDEEDPSPRRHRDDD